MCNPSNFHTLPKQSSHVEVEITDYAIMATRCRLEIFIFPRLSAVISLLARWGALLPAARSRQLFIEYHGGRSFVRDPNICLRPFVGRGTKLVLRFTPVCAGIQSWRAGGIRLGTQHREGEGVRHRNGQ